MIYRIDYRYSVPVASNGISSTLRDSDSDWLLPVLLPGTGTPDGTEGGREITDDGGGAIQVCTAGGGAAVQVLAMLF